MRPIVKYVSEIDGFVYDTEKEAVEAEKKGKGIEELVGKYKKNIDDITFSNGAYSIQRDKEYYESFKNAMNEAIKIYEPYTFEAYEKNCINKTDGVISWGMTGRYLDDNGSILYNYYYRFYCICKTCFREWGQPYYANNCKHSDFKLK